MQADAIAHQPWRQHIAFHDLAHHENAEHEAHRQERLPPSVGAEFERAAEDLRGHIAHAD